MNDEQLITAVIQTYFDSMYESSAEKALAAFHPNAKITGSWKTGCMKCPLAISRAS